MLALHHGSSQLLISRLTGQWDRPDVTCTISALIRRVDYLRMVRHLTKICENGSQDRERTSSALLTCSPLRA
jgi:hypothetical protein